MDRCLKLMLKQAKAQLKATEKLLHLNQKNLDDAKVLIEMSKHDARANKTKGLLAASKRLDTRF